MKKYVVDENFFANIDTENKAYWLGFLYADGYQDGYEIIIRLKVDDKEHLEKLKLDLNSSHPIRNTKEIGYFTKKLKIMSNLRIGSKKICNQLSVLGCVKAKSCIIRLPNLPEYLVRHFVRGYFDGDGSISKSGRGIDAVLYSGSVNFIDDIEKLFHNEKIGFSRYIDYNNYLRVRRKAELVKFYNYMYEDSTVFLDRKHNKFIEFLGANILLQ